MAPQAERGSSVGHIAGALVIVALLVLSGGVYAGTLTAAGTQSGITQPSMDGAEFTVVSFDAPEEVVFEDRFNISVVIENTGDEAATKLVWYSFRPNVGVLGTIQGVEVNGTYAGEIAEVSLEPGERIRLNRTIPSGVNGRQIGELKHGVFTPDDEVVSTVNMRQPPVVITDLRGPSADVERGEGVTVSANVTNNRSETITQGLEVQADFDDDGLIDIVATETVTLEVGETRRVSFDVDIPSDTAPGSYRYYITDEGEFVGDDLGEEDDEKWDSFVVNEATPVFSVGELQGPPDRVLGELDDPERAKQGEIITVSGLVTNNGDEAETRTVSMVFTPSDTMAETFEFRDQRSVTLEAGESLRVSFDIPLPVDVEPGQYGYRIDTGVDSASGGVTVDGTPVRESGFEFVDSVELEQRVPLGVETRIGTNVGNPTDAGVTGLVDFRFDANQDGVTTENETIARRLATLSPGLNEDTSIRYTLPEDTEPGLYLAEVVYGEASQETFLYVYDPEAPAQFVVQTGRVDPIEPGETYRVGSTVLNGGGVDENVSVEFRVDLDRDGELTADEVVATDRSAGPLEPGETFSPDLGWNVPADIEPGEIRYGVFAGETNVTRVTEVTGPEGESVYQLDLVEGEPIEQFAPDEGRTYHKQDRFINGKFVDDEAVNHGPATPHTYHTEECVVEYSGFGFDPDTGEASTIVEVRETDGCTEVTLTLAGYELPEGETGWNPDRIEDQELRDADTLTLEPGERVELVINVTE